jgi:hypothetical protein
VPMRSSLPWITRRGHLQLRDRVLQGVVQVDARLCSSRRRPARFHSGRWDSVSPVGSRRQSSCQRTSSRSGPRATGDSGAGQDDGRHARVPNRPARRPAYGWSALRESPVRVRVRRASPPRSGRTPARPARPTVTRTERGGSSAPHGSIGRHKGAPAVRSLRAAVFAALCARRGHGLATSAIPARPPKFDVRPL